MKKVFIINGYAESGKDTFVEMCLKYYPLVFSVSMVDHAKEIATECGWNGTKLNKDRKFLSDLKDLLDSYNDDSITYVDRKIYGYCKDLESLQVDGDPIIFIHSRQPEDIKKLVEKYNATTIFIKRETNRLYSNHADMCVEDYNYDIIIDNNSTLEEFEEKAKQFIKEFGGANSERVYS